MMMNKILVDGTKLRQLRVDSGVTQIEMAQKLGISRDTIISIEKNVPGTIAKLSFEKVNEWGRHCRSRVARSTYQEWVNYLKKMLSLD